MNEIEIAWLAGLFEGEGHIGFSGKYSVNLSINMTDEDVIEKCFKLASVGRRHGPYRLNKPNQKPMWSWIVAKEGEVRELLPLLLPWLSKRRTERADEAMLRLGKVRREGFCLRGHSMTGDNIYAPPCGTRMCRECIKIREKKRKRLIGLSVTGKNTTCRSGHPLIGDNVIKSKLGRQCRICRKAQEARTRFANAHTPGTTRATRARHGIIKT